ncbi:MAG: ParB/RepB/Spo0J family partition protein [Cyanobacteria bacterium P01_D01_bin.156]
MGNTANTEKRRRKRGLDQLLAGMPTVEAPEGDERICLIPIEQIIPAPTQPRSVFDDAEIEILAKAIESQGFTSIIYVRPKNGKYEIIAGERRWRAAKIAKIESVNCLVEELSDAEAFQRALDENVIREDLSKLEEVEAILHLIEIKHHIDRSSVVALIQAKGHHRRQIGGNVSPNVILDRIKQTLAHYNIQLETFRTKYLPLLNLPDELRQAHLSGGLGYNHVLEINKVKDPAQRQLLLNKAIDHKLSVRKIKEQIKALNKPPASKNRITTMGPPKPVKTLWTQLTKSSIWSDAQKVEKLIAAMQEALDIEPTAA